MVRPLGSVFLAFILSLVLMVTACNQSISTKEDNLKDSLVTSIEGRPIRGAAIKQAETLLEAVNFDNRNMVWIPTGSFKMGSDKFPDAQPVHEIQMDGFWMDEHEVTNAQFALFVEATGYQTVAERALDPADFPTVPLDMLVPGSFVLSPSTDTDNFNHKHAAKYIAGANWRHPAGPSSTIQGKENYPVVQVCYEDALAYARWIGKRLPTEAEWEYAARAGRQATKYYWGNELKSNTIYLANTFQGNSAMKDIGEDGFAGLAPIKSYEPNPVGLYDMDGNVWEWCSDFYRPDYYKSSPTKNPKGPSESFDPQEPGLIKRVQRGGSFLCNDQLCDCLFSGSRRNGEIASASNNMGFRCVGDAMK